MKKVAFDFDGTLHDHFHGQHNPNKKAIQNLLKQLSEDENFSVYIITRRYGPEYSEKGKGNEHQDIYDLLDELNLQLPEEKIIFTNREMKYYTIVNLGIDIHIDDEFRDRELINKFTKGSTVDATQSNWRTKFDELL